MPSDRGEGWPKETRRTASVDRASSTCAHAREQYTADANGGSAVTVAPEDRRAPADGRGEGVFDAAAEAAGVSRHTSLPAAAAFACVKGASLVAALLAHATASRELDEGPRRKGGRVVFCPFAVRVVTVPSGFLTCHELGHVSPAAC